MRVVNADLIGWERARTAQVRGIVNLGLPQELVWLTVSGGRADDPVAVMVRPRVPAVPWHAPGPGERLEVLAWTPDEAAIEDLELGAALGLDAFWAPAQSAAARVLWVEG